MTKKTSSTKAAQIVCNRMGGRARQTAGYTCKFVSKYVCKYVWTVIRGAVVGGSLCCLCAMTLNAVAASFSATTAALMTVLADDRQAFRPSNAAYRIPHAPTQPQPQLQRGRANRNAVAAVLLRAHRPFVTQQKQRQQKKMYKKWKWNGRTVGVKLLGESGKATAAVVAKKKLAQLANQWESRKRACYTRLTEPGLSVSDACRFATQFLLLLLLLALIWFLGAASVFLCKYGKRYKRVAAMYSHIFVLARESLWLWSASKYKYEQIEWRGAACESRVQTYEK